MAERRRGVDEKVQTQRIVVGDQQFHATFPFSRGWPQSAPLSGSPRMPILFRFAGIVLAVLAGAQARAAGVRVAVDALHSGGVDVKKIKIELDATAGGVQNLMLSAQQLDWGDLSLQAFALEARCPLEAVAAVWRCSGQARLRPSPTAAAVEAGFVAQLADGRLNLEVNRAPARLSLQRHGDGDASRWQLQLRQLPLDWLQDLLRRSWPALTRVDGQLAFDLALPAGNTELWQADYSLRDLGFDTADGRQAAAHLNLAGKLDWRPGTPWRLQHRGQIGSGEVLAGPAHVVFADHGTRLEFGLVPERGAYRLDDVVYDDPGVLHIDGRALVDTSAPQPLRDASLSAVATLPQAQQRYAGSALGVAGWSGLTSSGRITAQAQLDAQGTKAATLRFAEVDLTEPERGLGIDALAGELDWRRDGAGAVSELGWKSARVYALPLGPARLRWQARDGALALASPAQLPLLDGRLHLQHLVVRPAAASGERFEAGFAVHDVALSTVSEAFGWPRFGGTLGGAVPQLRYSGERLDLTGGLLLDVFDGTVNVTGLALERPFGVSPSLSADIAFDRLDLSLLTGTFDIGGITGRLSGKIQALRLVDWQPVAFDAQLQALDGGRISQRAVNTISSVGGGGIAAGLQASMLKLFDTFGYARLGIGCRLHNAVCHMRGLDTDGSRYTLVEGRGLPRIQIVGHQAQVDWAVLVDRLQAAARGTRPVID